MVKAFDLAAKNYDATFTDSRIGRLQRKQVHFHLDRFLLKGKKMNVLEVSCGTGEDAKQFADQGHTVLATDVSHGMIEQAKAKVGDREKIKLRQMDLCHLGKQSFGKKFNLLFSNFGGVNCVPPQELKEFIGSSFDHLKSDGYLALVIMPKNCLWDQFYFLLKGKRKKAFRRNSNTKVAVNVEGETVDTWYYNPSDIKPFAGEGYNLETIKPIGFMVPPSYLNRSFKSKERLLRVFDWLDRRLFDHSWLARYADHYLIVFRKI